VIESETYEYKTPEGTAYMMLELPCEHPDEDVIREALHAWTDGGVE
jgi:hypothetical protein